MIRAIALSVIVACAALGSLPPAAVRASAEAPEAASAPAPSRVVVRTGDHDGFGRLVFDWTRNVDYAVTQDGNRATIRFSQAAIVDPRFLDRLPKTVLAAETATTGNSVTITLTVADLARLRHFRNGTHVVLDVLAPATPRTAAPTPWQSPLRDADRVEPPPSRVTQAAPPAVPQAAPQTASPTPPPGPHRSTEQAASTSDDKAGAATPPQVLRGPQNLLARPAPETKPASPSDHGSAPSAPSQSPAAAATAQSRPKEDLSTVLLAIFSPSKPELPLQSRPEPNSPTPGAPMSAAPATVPPVGEASALAEPRPTDPSSRASAQASAPAESRAAKAPTPAASPTTAKPAATAAAASSPAPPRTSRAAAQRLVMRPLGTINELAGVRFSWPQEVGVAAYERSNHLWLVFDRSAAVEVTGAWPRNAVKPQVVATSAATVLRWALPAGKNAGLRREGADWIVDLLPVEARPPADMPPETHLAAQAGPRLIVRGSRFGRARELRDPEVGDQLWVVPIAAAGHGSAHERRFVELQMVPTLQGLVIKPLVDDLIVRNIPDGIEVTVPGGLHLSGNAAPIPNTPAAPQAPRVLVDRSAKLFDFAAWSAARTGRSFLDHKRDLQRAVIDVPPTARNGARLAFARFLFAHGYMPDALGVLQVIEEDDASAANDPAFRSLRGAARYLSGDYAAAAPDLFFATLDTEREIALWRAALLASQNDWLAASRYFIQADSVLRVYPADLRFRFGLLAAETALVTGDSGLAKFHLDELSRLKPARVWRDQIDYVIGKVMAKGNDVDGAAAVWQRAMTGVHRPTKVKARLARTELLLAHERISPAEAIAEVETLRYAWRGDDIELAVLKRLGELYIGAREYREGLTALRDALTYFPKAIDAVAIGEQMRAAFATLYLHGEADKLPPLSALALYEDFKDLSPAGEAGDIVVSKLVDRLVSVELLDRAADVLKHQMENRLKGVALAEAGNRLSVIHLLNRRPEDALTVLNGSLPNGVGAAVQVQRRQLKARTLGELARYKEALALLDGDNSQDADRLRAEIGWRTQNWPLAAYAFGRLVPKADQAMTDSDRQTVLRLAIAQSLGKNTAALKDLRKLYGAEMAQSALKESFDLVTAPPGRERARDLRAITSRVAEVDQFRAFLTSYRDKLLTQRGAPPKPVSSNATDSTAQTASN